MLCRTWPYGTVKKVKVEDVKRVSNGKSWLVMCIGIDDNEGYMLLGELDGAVKNETGEIVFTQGGPTGGYWKYRKPT